MAPFYTLLPKRWRGGAGYESERALVPAALISGLGEACVALLALSLWYMYYFNMLGQKYSAFRPGSAHFAFGSTEVAGGAVFITFALNPLTWVIIYFGVEGIIRTLGALATGEVVGMLPLYGFELAWRAARSKRPAELSLVADEILPGGGNCDIQIASCRQREGWKYPFTLRYAGAYFQVIGEKYMGAGPRPYIYSLRRLPMGEIARGLHNYDPTDVLRPAFKVQPL
ncbi:MAG TPA: hypothetical protein VJS43_17415 [Candidatus Acidoferrales bacterium]|nr:hypothetical protein [Candidatus Acidoferrales bacterium]